MTPTVRSQEEIIERIRVLHRLIDAEPAGSARSQIWYGIGALVWAAGGCVSPWHPPECKGYGTPCTIPD